MKDAFCTRHQDTTAHEVTLDRNGDFVFKCSEDIETGAVDEKGKAVVETCGRFFKVSGELSKAEVEEALETHQAANEGQVSVEKQEEKLKALLEEE